MSWFSEAVNFIAGADTRQDAGHTITDATKYWDNVQGPRSESTSTSTSTGHQGSYNTSSQTSSQSSQGSSFQNSSSGSHSEQFATYAENVATELSKLGAKEYERYSNMFGGLEDNLNDYFNNLNPDQFAAQQNQTVQQQYDQTLGKIRENLAARGLYDSGAEAQATLGMGMQLAQQKAQNEFNAPHQVAQMQQQWLGQGYDRMNAAMGAMGSEQVATVGGGGFSDASSSSVAGSQNSSFGSSNASSFGTSFGNQQSSSQSHSLATDDSRKAQGLTDIAMGVASNQIGEGNDRGSLFGGLIGMGTSAILGGLF